MQVFPRDSRIEPARGHCITRRNRLECVLDIPIAVNETMVTDQTRNDVWQELLDAARLVRYYETLSDRYRRRHQGVRVVLLLAASSAIIALLALFPENLQQWVQLIAGALIASTVIWDFVFDYARKAAVLHTLSMECGMVEIELKALWDKMENIGDDEAQRSNTHLARRMADVTGRAGQADIQEDLELNHKCAEAAYRVMEDQYAT